MKNKIKINKNHIINSIFRYIYMLSFVASISLWISVCILNYRQKPDNTGLIEFEVVQVVFDE